MELDEDGRHVLSVTPICRHGAWAAMQPLAAGGVHVSFELQLLGAVFTVQLPTLRLAGGNDSSSCESAAARRRRRRSSFSSQGSGVSRAASEALSLGTADEAVATLRQRLSIPPGAQAACSSAEAGGSVSAGDQAAAAGMSVADMLRASGEEMNDACLLRWLAARDRDVDEAEHSLREHARWRYSYIPNGRISEDEIPNELAVNKVFLQGCDKQGRPVMIVVAARHDMGTRRLEETNRLIVYALDNAAAMATDVKNNPLGKFLCLFDLSGLRMNNLDVKALRDIFELLQGHFPERLSQLWFLNAPFIFWGLWRLVAPFIEPATRDKIVFLSGAERAARLQGAIPPQVLPRQYGGEAEMVPAAEAAAALRAGGMQRKDSRRRNSAHERPAPAPEGRLTAARNAVGGAFTSAWSAIKRGGAAMTHIRVPAPHLPPLPRPHLWWQRDNAGSGASGVAQQQLVLMRQRSVALQQAVAQSRLASAMAKSRFASVSRRLGSRLQPLVNPKVLLRTVWAQARRVALWAWSKAPALRPGSQLRGSPGAEQAERPAPGHVILRATPLDGGLRPY